MKESQSAVTSQNLSQRPSISDLFLNLFLVDLQATKRWVRDSTADSIPASPVLVISQLFNHRPGTVVRFKAKDIWLMESKSTSPVKWHGVSSMAFPGSGNFNYRCSNSWFRWTDQVIWDSYPEAEIMAVQLLKRLIPITDLHLDTVISQSIRIFDIEPLQERMTA